MPRKHRQILPFRIPFFRIFYSTTYTITFLITLFFLAITPGSLLWEAVNNDAWQYVFIISGVYILTAILALFIYSSRLYTNRSVLAGVGKAYIPVEEGELGRSTRKLIKGQLERSAIVAWEAKPRDIKGEVAFAEKEGLLSDDNTNELGDIETIGTLVPVDINDPPWGDIQHAGWTAPSDAPSELQSDLQFEVVIAELANLLEARAVSLAPPLQGEPDLRFVEILRRQEKMGMREYLTQLSYLQLVDLNTAGGDFLRRYERARFSGQPTTYQDFKMLMATFGLVLEAMKQIDPAIAAEIQAQVTVPQTDGARNVSWTVDAASSQGSFTDSMENISPVTARTRATTPYLSQTNDSQESFSSVLRPSTAGQDPHQGRSTSLAVDNDSGSILRHP